MTRLAGCRARSRRNSNSTEAQFALGRAYAAKNDREQAIKAFNETLAAQPSRGVSPVGALQTRARGWTCR